MNAIIGLLSSPITNHTFTPCLRVPPSPSPSTNPSYLLSLNNKNTPSPPSSQKKWVNRRTFAPSTTLSFDAGTRVTRFIVWPGVARC